MTFILDYFENWQIILFSIWSLEDYYIFLSLSSSVVEWTWYSWFSMSAI